MEVFPKKLELEKNSGICNLKVYIRKRHSADLGVTIRNVRAANSNPIGTS